MVNLGDTNTIIVGQADVDTVSDILKKEGIQGAFIFPGTGFWEGEKETAVCIFLDGLPLAEVVGICGALRDTFGQDCVLLRRNGEAYLV